MKEDQKAYDYSAHYENSGERKAAPKPVQKDELGGPGGRCGAHV